MTVEFAQKPAEALGFFEQPETSDLGEAKA